MPIKITQECFTGMVVIRATDKITGQVLCLTPDQAAELRAGLNEMTIERVDDPASNLESERLIGLTIYNGHSLPVINRQKYEAGNTLSVKFELQVYQRLKGYGKSVSKIVVTL